MYCNSKYEIFADPIASSSAMDETRGGEREAEYI